MKCPYCNKEMERGAMQSACSLHYVP